MSTDSETAGTREAADATHGGRRLRVGVFAPSSLQPRWIVEALAKVGTSDYAEVVVLAEGKEVPQEPHWLWRAYRRVDAWLFGSQPDPSEQIGIRSRIPHGRSLTLPPFNVGAGAMAAWRAELRKLRLDVAFALGAVDDRMLEGVAKYGVWRHYFGEARGSLEAVAGFHEVIDGAPVTASGLKIRREAGDERVVYQSWSRTIPLSVARNRNNLLHKTAQFADRALRELHRSGYTWLRQCASLPRASREPSATPGTAETLRGLSKLVGRIARRGIQKLLYVDQWFLAYRFRRKDERGQDDLRRFRYLLPPKDRYWADPFPIERGGRHYIFFEELVFAAGKAHIAMVEVARDGICSAPIRVLERDYHLSYPFLVEHDGQLFMVPETGKNRTVEIYRCIDFPGRWRLEKVLLRGARYTDATLHRSGDRWWMFVNIGVEGSEAHDELHLYSAKQLLGEWRPHPGNPVKSDARSARPAGSLFARGGALYRPAQICAPLYGSGVSINRVLHLSPRAYLEREEERILPTQHAQLLGIHTTNRAGELTVIDGFMRRRRAGNRDPGAWAPQRPVPFSTAVTALPGSVRLPA